MRTMKKVVVDLSDWEKAMVLESNAHGHFKDGVVKWLRRHGLNKNLFCEWKSGRRKPGVRLMRKFAKEFFGSESKWMLVAMRFEKNLQ